MGVGEARIDVRSVGKRFNLARGENRTIKSFVLNFMRRPTKRDFWALKDVTFQVGRGETLGIIGANGAGKSTLLSIVAETIKPTTGSVSVSGTVSSLLELGAGFHPDFTGRENVFLYGAILGLSRRQIEEKYEKIIEFAELKDFEDEPVRHYSSGMYVRLGFAVAVEVDPDILIVDEVLAVGDIAFQRKCIGRINEFKRSGKTMLIVSHDMPTIQSLSDRILLLSEGQIAGIGAPSDVVNEYQSKSRYASVTALKREWGTGEARIVDVEMTDASGIMTDRFKWGSPCEIKIDFEAAAKIKDPVFGFSISDSAGRVVYGNNTQIEGVSIPYINGRGSIVLSISELRMAAGSYFVSLSLHSSDHRTNYHRLDNCFGLRVDSGKQFEGTYMPCKWTVKG